MTSATTDEILSKLPDPNLLILAEGTCGDETEVCTMAALPLKN